MVACKVGRQTEMNVKQSLRTMTAGSCLAGGDMGQGESGSSTDEWGTESHVSLRKTCDICLPPLSQCSLVWRSHRVLAFRHQANFAGLVLVGTPSVAFAWFHHGRGQTVSRVESKSRLKVQKVVGGHAGEGMVDSRRVRGMEDDGRLVRGGYFGHQAR